jgi:serine protease Do
MWRLLSLLLVVLVAGAGFFVGQLSAQSRLVTPDEINNVEITARSLKAVVTVIGRKDPQLVERGDDPLVVASGFFVKPNLVLTNYHNVADLSDYEIELYDGRRFKVVVQALDAGADLALLKVNAVQAPGILRWGASNSLLQGQKLIVLGSPLRKRNNVMVGVFSSINRIESDELSDDLGTEIPAMLLTDANIQQGNSGGPVLDSKGLVVGVVDANLSNQVGTGGLIGLLIPSNFARESSEDMERFGVSQRGYLGATFVNVTDLDPFARKAVGLSSSQGAMIDVLNEGESGAKAGLRAAQRDESSNKIASLGDIILKVNDKTVRNQFDVLQEVARSRVGQTISLSVWRNGRASTVRVPLVVRSRDR